MNERSTISAGISVSVGEISPAYFSLNLRPPRELSFVFGIIKAFSWHCSGLLPGVSPVFDRTETILEEIFSPLARLQELSLGALLPPSARSRVWYHQGIFLAL